MPTGDDDAADVGTPRPGGEAAAYVLRLYVTGTTARSARAITNLRRICEERLKGQYDLEVVDIYRQPDAARDHQIIAAPTLVKVLPEPLRRIIGDLSDHDRVLAGLGLQTRPEPLGGTG